MAKLIDLLQKETAIVACMDALAPLNSFDFSPSELTAALQEAYEALNTKYPNMRELKRKVVKARTVDSYAVKAENDLRLCLEGKGTLLHICSVNAYISDALEQVQKEMKAK